MAEVNLIRETICGRAKAGGIIKRFQEPLSILESFYKALFFNYTLLTAPRLRFHLRNTRQVSLPMPSSFRKLRNNTTCRQSAASQLPSVLWFRRKPDSSRTIFHRQDASRLPYFRFHQRSTSHPDLPSRCRSTRSSEWCRQPF